jgi:regulatory protein
MIEALRLKKGQQLTDAEIERLRGLDAIEVAHEAALSFLSYRPRSIAEVRENLQKKEFSAETIESVIARLTETRLLDDEAFARYWVDNREQFGPRSARALRFELRRKGVSDDAIQVSLDGLDEDMAAYRAGKAQARRLSAAEELVFRKRLGDYLLRRGFSYGVIKQVVKTLWEESSGSGGDRPDDLNFDDMNAGE